MTIRKPPYRVRGTTAGGRVIIPYGQHAGKSIRSIDAGGDRGYLILVVATWLQPERARIRLEVMRYLEATELRDATTTRTHFNDKRARG